MPYYSHRERIGYPGLLYSQIDFFDKTNLTIAGEFSSLCKVFANARAIIGTREKDDGVEGRLKEITDKIAKLFHDYDPLFEQLSTTSPKEMEYRLRLFDLNCQIQSLIADSKLIDYERPEGVTVE